MEDTSKKRLLLVDGSAVLHRAFHAMPELTDSKGRPAGAVLGFVRMLIRTIEDLHPQGVIVAFDRREPTFRKELFIGYQAHRPPVDPSLGDQFGTTRELLAELQVPVLDKAGFEADDILGTLCAHVEMKKSGVREFDDVVVLTGDKDLMQLVTDVVKLYMPIKGVSEATMIGAAEVVEKLGVKPEQVIDLKALIGDSSDNYPGVPGVGPKTAQKLLTNLQSFEKIYDFLELNNFQAPIAQWGSLEKETEIDELKKLCTQSVLDKLKSGKESGELSRQLATIRCDVDILVDTKMACDAVTQMSQWSGILFDFGFKRLSEEMKIKHGEQLGLAI